MKIKNYRKRNKTTGFWDPVYKYHEIINLKTKKEGNKWALEKKLHECLEIFYEKEFIYKKTDKSRKGELQVYARNDKGNKTGSPFWCDYYAEVDGNHIDYEFNGNDHYTSAFKIHTDHRKANIMKDHSKNTNKNSEPGKNFKIFKVPYYLQLTRDVAKYLFRDKSLELLGRDYYKDEKYDIAIKKIYNVNDERLILAPGLHNSKFTPTNYNETGMKRFLKEISEISYKYPSIKHQMIHSLQLYIDDVGKKNKDLIIPKNNKDFDKWFNIEVDRRRLNYIFLREESSFLNELPK